MNTPLTLHVEVTEANITEQVIVRAHAELMNERDEDIDLAPGCVIEIPVPSKLELCGKCSGRGKHSLRFGAFSGEALEEARADTEFWSSYTSGALDEACDRCGGTGRVNVPADGLPGWLREAVAEFDEEESLARAEHFSEMRAQYGLEYGPEFGDDGGW